MKVRVLRMHRARLQGQWSTSFERAMTVYEREWQMTKDAMKKVMREAVMLPVFTSWSKNIAQEVSDGTQLAFKQGSAFGKTTELVIRTPDNSGRLLAQKLEEIAAREGSLRFIYIDPTKS